MRGPGFEPGTEPLYIENTGFSNWQGPIIPLNYPRNLFGNGQSPILPPPTVASGLLTSDSNPILLN